MLQLKITLLYEHHRMYSIHTHTRCMNGTTQLFANKLLTRTASALAISLFTGSPEKSSLLYAVWKVPFLTLFNFLSIDQKCVQLCSARAFRVRFNFKSFATKACSPNKESNFIIVKTLENVTRFHAFVGMFAHATV